VASGRGLGRPALSRDTLVFDVGAARIDAINLRTGRRHTLRREARVQLRGPSALSGRLLYVRASYRRQEVRVGPLRPAPTSRDRVLYGTVPTNRGDTGEEPGHEHAPGHHESMWPRPRPGVADTLWTTALGPRTAYVTRLRQIDGQPLRTSVLRLPR
jgi:hypothetical protein